jgi:hypothetical protein
MAIPSADEQNEDLMELVSNVLRRKQSAITKDISSNKVAPINANSGQDLTQERPLYNDMTID